MMKRGKSLKFRLTFYHSKIFMQNASVCLGFYYLFLYNNIWRVVFKCFCDQKLFPTYLSCLIKLSLFRHIELSNFRLSTLCVYSKHTYAHTQSHNYTHTIERKCNVIKIISLDNTIEMRTKLVCLLNQRAVYSFIVLFMNPDMLPCYHHTVLFLQLDLAKKNRVFRVGLIFNLDENMKLKI